MDARLLIVDSMIRRLSWWERLQVSGHFGRCSDCHVEYREMRHDIDLWVQEQKTVKDRTA